MMYTGERLIPERFALGERIVIEHLDRYRFASHLIASWRNGPKDLRELRILDAPCGVGYGAALLAEQTGGNVVGIDNDQETINHARRNYYAIPGLKFHTFDLDVDALAENEYDIVVCFEGIEHVQKQAIVAEKLARAVKRPGMIIVSTPRRGGEGSGSVFHTHELTREELYGLFSPYLVTAEMYGQNLHVADCAPDADPRYFVLVGMT